MTEKKTLNLPEKEGKSREQQIADIALSGLANGALLTTEYSKAAYGELGLSECMETLRQKVKGIQGGNLAEVEALLTAQAVSLDAIYTALARRALMNMGEYMGAAETYLRLALKAQSQSRATMETLATIKNPPMVIAKQANITSGPQQVNNGSNTRAHAPARAGNSETAPNKLLEESHEERMDARAPQTAGGANTELETVGALNRPAHS